MLCNVECILMFCHKEYYLYKKKITMKYCEIKSSNNISLKCKRVLSIVITVSTGSLTLAPALA